MTARLFSLLLVGVQFAAIGGLVLTGPIIPTQAPALILFAAGGALGAWAWLTMGSRLRIHPDPHPEGHLVTRGPYRFLRHPMYTCTLLLGAAWLSMSVTRIRITLFAVLLIDLLIKSRYEEHLLSARYPGYQAYRRATIGLLPFL